MNKAPNKMSIMDTTATINETEYMKALVDFPPRSIRNDADNEKVTRMLEALYSQGDLSLEKQAVAEVLITLIQSYEKRYAIEAAAPREVLVELMAANDLKQTNLVHSIFSSKGLVSQIVHGKREISKKAALKRGARFNVPHTLFL